MRNTLVIVCALALLAGAGQAWGQNDGDYRYMPWGSAPYTWNTVGNWEVYSGGIWSSSGALPTIDTNIRMEDVLGGASPYTVMINAAGAYCSNMEFNLTNATVQVVAGGDFSAYGCLTSYQNPGTGNGGMFEVAGGTARLSGFRHGRWGNNGGNYATVKISSGILMPYYRPDPEGSGKIGDCGFHMGESSVRGAITHIVGSGSSITILGGESSGAVAWDLRSYGTLIAELDTGGISTIVCDTSVSANLLYDSGDNATFNGGVIDMQGVAPTVGTSYTLLTADRIANTNVALAVDDQLGTSTWTDGNWWNLTINQGVESGLAANNGNNASVVVTYLAPTKTLYWDTNGTTAGIGGTGNWDTATTNWTESDAGTGPMEAWNNTNADATIANFTQSSAGETATLTTGISASEIQLSSPGAMTITGNTLTMVTPMIGGSPILKTLTDDTDVTIDSVIAGTAGFAKTSATGMAGKVTLAAANTYSGKTYITGGTLVVTNNDALGATGAGNGVEASGGALGLSGGVTLPAGEDIDIADTGINNIAGDNTIAGDITTIADYATISAASGSTLTVNGDVDIAKYRLSVAGGGTVIFNGVISGGPGGSSEAGNFHVSSTGTTVILNGDNTYNGYTYVWWGSDRKVIITHDNALGSAGNEWGYTQIGRSRHTLGLMGGITCAEELRIGYTGNSDGEGGYVGVIENISGDNTLTGAIKIMESSGAYIGATAGTLTITQGIVEEGGTRTMTKVGQGTLILNGANTYTGDTTVSAGTLGGSGSFVGNVIVEDGATLAPGTSTGTLTIGGDLTLAATAAVNMEVGGTSDFDQLPVGGTATLAGTLDMSRVGGFIPTKDQEFSLLTAGSIDNSGGLALSPEDVGTWELTVTDGAAGSVVTKWLPAFPGDANADGDVNDSDLSILLSNFGDPGAWGTGDFNGDSTVDDADLSLLLSNFGSVTTSTVPEPATLTLLGLGALALIRRRRQ